MLKIENLSKSYGEKKAVDGVSLHIKAGEICAFIGHNGAGKTTTLKACCGILAFEVGINEAAAVAEILKTNGFTNIGFKNDLIGIQRVVFGTANNV